VSLREVGFGLKVLAIIDWYYEGVPDFDPITELQKLFLNSHKDDVMPLLSPEERVNVHIVGYEEWISTLDKFESMDLIGEIKDQTISKRIANRELFRRGRHKRRRKQQTMRDKLRKRDEGSVRKHKWWDTDPLKKDSFERDR